MDSSKYSVVEEFDTAIGDSLLYYSMTENEETFDERSTQKVQTVVKKRPSDGTPLQVVNKNILQKRSSTSTPIPVIRVTKCKEFEELGVDFLKENEEYKKNENLSDEEKRKSWDCLANKEEMVKNAKKFTDIKKPAQNVKFKDQEKADVCTYSEANEEDDKTIENESLINNFLVNSTDCTAVDNDDKENKPVFNIPTSGAKGKNREGRKSHIPTIHKKTVHPHICICPNPNTHDPVEKTPVKIPPVHTPQASDLEFSRNLPEILGSIEKLMRTSARRSVSAKKPKTPGSARKTIYSFALRKVSLTGQNTSRKSFLSPNIIAGSAKRRRPSIAKPAATVTSNTCKYCFKEFKIAKALSNHLLENCTKIPPAEKRKLTIENISKIKASKDHTSQITSGNMPPPTKSHARISTAEHSGIYRTLKPLRCHSCKESYPTVYQFAEHMAHHSKR